MVDQILLMDFIKKDSQLLIKRPLSKAFKRRLSTSAKKHINYLTNQ